MMSRRQMAVATIGTNQQPLIPRIRAGHLFCNTTVGLRKERVTDVSARVSCATNKEKEK